MLLSFVQCHTPGDRMGYNQDESARSERRCGGNIKLNLEQREGETRQHTFLVNREMETMLWGSFMRERE